MNDTSAGGVPLLNALLVGELAAVNAYQRVLRSAESRATADVAEILCLASEHQRAAAVLQGVIREMGGVPASEAEEWGAFTLPTVAAMVCELLRGEEAGLRMYEAAQETVDGDARELVTLEFIPRQHKSIAELRAIIATLTACSHQVAFRQ